MFKLMFQGSTIIVAQPSEIKVSLTGIEIKVLGAIASRGIEFDQLDEKLEQVSALLPEKVGKKIGRVKDPNSIRAKIEECMRTPMKYNSKKDVIDQVQEMLHDRYPYATVKSYVYQLWKSHRPTQITEVTP